MIQCPNCRAYNIDSASFCKECGRQLQNVPSAINNQPPVVTTNPTVNNNRSALAVVLGILLAITLVISIVMYNDVSRSKSYYYSQYSEYYDKYGSTNSELSSLKSAFNGMYGPIVVSNIEIRREFKDNQLKYFYPTIYYTSVKSQTITLKNKFYRTGKNMANYNANWIHEGNYECTLTTSAYKSSSCELNGWGYPKDGYWQNGDYRYEIWYGDKCLGVKYFTVY